MGHINSQPNYLNYKLLLNGGGMGNGYVYNSNININ